MGVAGRYFTRVRPGVNDFLERLLDKCGFFFFWFPPIRSSDVRIPGAPARQVRAKPSPDALGGRGEGGVGTALTEPELVEAQ